MIIFSYTSSLSLDRTSVSKIKIVEETPELMVLSQNLMYLCMKEDSDVIVTSFIKMYNANIAAAIMLIHLALPLAEFVLGIK